MNIKKFTSIGVLAVVVIGCILAAGCTSAPEQSGAQQATSQTDSDPIVGQWITNDYPNTYGDIVSTTAVMSILPDGSGFWTALAPEMGVRLIDIDSDNWTKTSENTYLLTSKSGKEYVFTYDPEKDTLTADYGVTYARPDPIVGIWCGAGHESVGNGTVTLLIKDDGTGVGTFIKDDNSIMAAELVWEKNADGTYAVTGAYGGDLITYTISEDGKTITTADGRIKTKRFLDLTFFISTLGIWYNQDTGYFAVFNGDGTGVFYADNTGHDFVWRTGNPGEFIITNLEEIVTNNGTDLYGKEILWKYDREENIFNCEYGKYIRLNSEITIPDIITVQLT